MRLLNYDLVEAWGMWQGGIRHHQVTSPSGLARRAGDVLFIACMSYPSVIVHVRKSKGGMNNRILNPLNRFTAYPLREENRKIKIKNKENREQRKAACYLNSQPFSLTLVIPDLHPTSQKTGCRETGKTWLGVISSFC